MIVEQAQSLCKNKHDVGFWKLSKKMPVMFPFVSDTTYVCQDGQLPCTVGLNATNTIPFSSKNSCFFLRNIIAKNLNARFFSPISTKSTFSQFLKKNPFSFPSLETTITQFNVSPKSGNRVALQIPASLRNKIFTSPCPTALLSTCSEHASFCFGFADEEPISSCNCFSGLTMQIEGELHTNKWYQKES